MTIKNFPEFDPEFPEKFPFWGQLDSPKLDKLATALVSRINSEMLLVPNQRHATAGCRFALNQIAQNEEI